MFGTQHQQRRYRCTNCQQNAFVFYKPPLNTVSRALTNLLLSLRLLHHYITITQPRKDAIPSPQKHNRPNGLFSILFFARQNTTYK